MGAWQGELLWYQIGKHTPQKVKMELQIQPTDTLNLYTWQLIYGKEEKDNRPYLLKPVNTATGHWVIDEQNGIVLDGYWIGGRFNSAFTVLTSTIINNYWLEGEAMIVEFTTITAKPIATTGAGTKEVPFVNSYAVKSYQKAILHRAAKPQKLPLRKLKN